MSPSMGELTLAVQLGWLKIPQPTLEYRFDPRRRWRFDFAWPLLKVAAEVEGGSWTAGRHTRGSGFEADCEKYAEAAIAGWLVVRVTTAMVEDGRAITFIERAIAARKGECSMNALDETLRPYLRLLGADEATQDKIIAGVGARLGAYEVDRLAEAMHGAYDRDPTMKRIEWTDLSDAEKGMWRRHARVVLERLNRRAER